MGVTPPSLTGGRGNAESITEDNESENATWGRGFDNKKSGENKGKKTRNMCRQGIWAGNMVESTNKKSPANQCQVSNTRRRRQLGDVAQRKKRPRKPFEGVGRMGLGEEENETKEKGG